MNIDVQKIKSYFKINLRFSIDVKINANVHFT